MVHDGEEGEPDQDQRAADCLPSESDDQTDEHRGRGGEEQNLSWRQNKWVGHTLANRKDGDQEEEQGADDAGGPSCDGQD